jgi:hypothetical protein
MTSTKSPRPWQLNDHYEWSTSFSALLEHCKTCGAERAARRRKPRITHDASAWSDARVATSARNQIFDAVVTNQHELAIPLARTAANVVIYNKSNASR